MSHGVTVYRNIANPSCRPWPQGSYHHWQTCSFTHSQASLIHSCHTLKAVTQYQLSLTIVSGLHLCRRVEGLWSTWPIPSSYFFAEMGLPLHLFHAAGLHRSATEVESHDCLMTVLRFSYYFLITFSWLSHDFLITFSRLSHDFFKAFSWFSHDILIIFSWFSQDFLATYWYLSGNFLSVFWQLLATFWLLSDNFLAIFWQLFGNFLAIFLQLYGNFMEIFWQLSGNCLAFFCNCLVTLL